MVGKGRKENMKRKKCLYVWFYPRSPAPPASCSLKTRQCWSLASSSGIGVFVGLPLQTLLLPLRPFSSYRVASSSLDMRIYTYSYCILLCQYAVDITEGLLFSEGKWRSRDSGSEGRTRTSREKRAGFRVHCMAEEYIKRKRICTFLVLKKNKAWIHNLVEKIACQSTRLESK